MAAKFTIVRCLELPTPLAASTMYIRKVADNKPIEIYFSNSDGSEAFPTLTESYVAQMIAGVSPGGGSLYVVPDITARDALSLAGNAMVMVLDATGDTAVHSGAALYVYQFSTTTFLLIAKYESLDITWDKVTGRPVSTPAEIDDAVSKAHTHTNQMVLDQLGVNTGGQLTFDGATVGSGDVTVVTPEW